MGACGRVMQGLVRPIPPAHHWMGRWKLLPTLPKGNERLQEPTQSQVLVSSVCVCHNLLTLAAMLSPGPVLR